MGFKFKDRQDLKAVGLQDYCTDLGWRFDDKIGLDVVGVDEKTLDKFKDDYPGAFKPTPTGEPHPSGLGMQPGQAPVTNSNTAARGLVVYVAATHAGLITRNNGFYMPDRMRAGIPSWTDLYPKPVQLHHDDHSDPVGRVLTAEYVDTSNLVADQYKDFALRDSARREVGLADASFWKDFVGTKKSFIQKLQMVKLMDSVLSDKHYRGVGYTKLALDITDPETAQKIMDRRYMTVSIGAVSDKAVCSICDTNWLEEEHCGHRPGQVYDGKTCFIVAGNLENDEVSWVNTPADRHASVLGIEGLSVADSMKDHTKIFMYPIADTFHREDSVMDQNENTAEALKDDSANTSEEVKDTSSVADEGSVEDGKANEAAAADAESTNDVAEEDQVKDDVSSSEDVNEEQKFLDQFFVDEAEVEDSNSEPNEEDCNRLYDMLAAKLDDETQKLSVEDRKKLPKSAFCGPGRSFPVTDCAHVTAARSLLDQYKGEGSKKAIVAAIDRKAKALGYSEPEDSTSTPVEEVEDGRLTTDVVRSLLHAIEQGLYGVEWDEDSQNEAPILSDEEAKTLRSLISELVKRVGKDNFMTAADIKDERDELDAQVAEAERLEDSLGQKMDQLEALRQELRASYADMAAMQDQLTDLHGRLKDQKVQRATALHQLNGSFTDEVKESLATLSDEVLDSKLEVLSSEVDMTKIADKVNDGLSRTPDEQVENPVPTTTEPSVVEDNQTPPRQPTHQTQVWVDNTHRRFLLSELNPEKAEAFYKDAVRRGLAKPRPGDLE